MITSSRAMKLAVVAVAISAHGVLAVAMMPPPPPQIEGGAGSAEVRLGTSFADMAAGVMTPEASDTALAPQAAAPASEQPPTRQTAQPVTPDSAQPVTPSPTQQATAERSQPAKPPAQPIRQATAKPSPAATPTQIRATQPSRQSLAAKPAGQAEPVKPALAAQPPIAQLSTAQPPAALPPSVVAVVPPSDTPAVEMLHPETTLAPSGQNTQPLRPAPPPTAQALTPETSPTETVVAENPDHATVARSLRPMQRSRAFEAAAQPKAQAFADTQRKARAAAQQRARAQTAPKRGNSQQNARAGASSGTRSATARTSGTGGTKRNTSGSAAASSYRNVVLSCVSRAGRPNVSGRGTAGVSFGVSGNGRITGVSLTSRSGNAALDRAAVNLVRRVGSCPPPPPGARRSYSISISAR